MRVNTKKYNGLSDAEANNRLLRFGYNEVPADKSKKIYDIIWEIVSEPMVGLLLACGIIYLILGDKIEAIVLLFSVFGVIGITIYQARKSEKSLEALRNLSSPRAIVVRGGMKKRLPGKEVVPGDIVILIEGDRIPADADILECTNLKVDESLLTGESVPVDKKIMGPKLKDKKEGQVFSGSLVVKGHAVAQVFATGRKTGVGRIGESLQSLSIEKTLLQKEVSRVIKGVAIIGLSMCIVLIVVYTLTRGDLISGFLAGLTMAMGILPEEFPIVLTLFITMGAFRLARRQVLARRAATIETLGAATVLCVDKTGTLTENKMRVEEIYQDVDVNITEKSYPLDEMSYYLVLSSQKTPFDPMENAFLNLRKNIFKDMDEVYKDMELVGEYPVEDRSLAMVHVWSTGTGNKHEVAAKGAPEAIFDLCDLTKKERSIYEEKVEEMAKCGLRVLAVGRGEYIGKKLPKLRDKYNLEFLGLVGLIDPVRPEVHHAIKECYSAGIRVIMITGDYPATAENIAHRIGLTSPGGVLTGEEMDKMNDAKLKERIEFVNIFSRVTPENKLRIVEALKKKGEVVAMTGDGVNDAPALKAAHIGIAMGERGTDVAREASALVLLDDDFSSIVGGVKLGRRIYGNLQKAIKYLFTVHVPIAGLSLLPVIFKWPLVLYPVHIVFMELIIDPTCTLVFEAEKEEDDVMERKPRKVKESIFSKPMVINSIIEGFIVLVITLLSYKVTMDIGWSIEKSRAFTFLVLIISNVLIILSNRSEVDSAIKRLIKADNKPFYIILAMFIAVVSFIYLTPWTQNIFKFGKLSSLETLLAIGLAIVSMAWLEIIKVAKRLV